jgi:hypothetical protein
MAAKSRRKGIEGEREVAAAWQAAGATVKAYSAAGTTNEGTIPHGDHLIVCANGLTIHSESKRAERLKLPEWLRQLEADAPQGTLPVLAFRQNRGKWYAVLALDDLTALVT